MKRIVLLLFVFYLFLPIGESFTYQNQEARLIFFDVGQGDSALLISPQGRTLLIDGGPNKVVVEKISKVLGRKKREIDWLVLSHEHKDHYVGLIALNDYYSFSQAILPVWSENLALLDYFKNLQKEKTKLIPLSDKMERFYLEENCYFDVLASPLLFMETNKSLSANDASFSVKINCFGLEALLTGDLEKSGEEALLKKASVDFLSAKIFKAGHHGSNTSNNLEFLQAVKPKVVVIPVGANNSYGHPGQKTLINIAKVKAKVLRSDINGDVEFLADNREIVIRTEF